MLNPKLQLVIAILGILAISGIACVQLPLTPTSKGTLQLYVTDAPPDDEVTSIMVTVEEVQVHRAMAEQEREQEQSGSGNQTPQQEQEREQEQQQTEQGEGEWITIPISSNATTFDLLQIEGIEQFLGASEVDSGKYTQIRLVVGKIQVALGDGELQDATVPSKELKLVHPFDIVAGETTAMVIDFDADKMVTVTGADKIIVKPVVKLTVRQENSTDETAEQEPNNVTAEQTSIELSCNDFMDAKHVNKKVALGVGDMFKVTLCSNPSTGFGWEPAEIRNQTVLQLLDQEFVPSEETGVVGAPGQEVLTLKALKKGTSSVSLEYGRPWEAGEKAEWTFKLQVVVK